MTITLVFSSCSSDDDTSAFGTYYRLFKEFDSGSSIEYEYDLNNGYRLISVIVNNNME